MSFLVLSYFENVIGLTKIGSIDSLMAQELQFSYLYSRFLIEFRNQQIVDILKRLYF